MENLNCHHLRDFRVAAKEGGSTRADAKLRVSEPGICTPIQALERAFGKKLPRRSGQRLALTEAGQRGFSFAEQMFPSAKGWRAPTSLAKAPALLSSPNSALRRSLEQWGRICNIHLRLQPAHQGFLHTEALL